MIYVCVFVGKYASPSLNITTSRYVDADNVFCLLLAVLDNTTYDYSYGHHPTMWSMS